MIIDNTTKQEPIKQTPFGSTPPATASIGDLFFKTTNRTLLVFSGNEWIALADEKRLAGFKKQFDSILAELANIPTLAARAEVKANDSLQTHANDGTLHLSPAAANLLDGINGISSLDLNRLSGINDHLSVAKAQNVSQVLKNLDADKLSTRGGVMTGDILMSSNRIVGLPQPSESSDAVTKQYVDSHAVGIKWLDCVEVATTKPIQLNGVDKIDAEVSRNGRRILVKNQQNPAENGIYIASYDAWERVAGFPTFESLDGYAVTVRLGQTQKNTSWLFTRDGVIELCLGASVCATITTGNGLLINENEISIDLGDRLSVATGKLDLAVVSKLDTDTILSVGSATQIPIISIDRYGRVIAASTINPSGFQPANIILSKLAISEPGLMVKVGESSIAKRSINVSGNGISVLNGDFIDNSPTIKLEAVATNTTNTIVFRDENGDFSANAITANLHGMADAAYVAETAKSVKWEDVSDKPTALSQFKNDSLFITSEQLQNALENINKQIGELKQQLQQ